MSVSLILPFYNPASNWAANVVERFELLQSRVSEPIQLILVNDGSINVSDRDTQLLKDKIHDCNIISYADNKGKGFAIRQGVEVASGDIILYTDIDFPYTIDSICKVYDELKYSDINIAMGVKDMMYYQSVPTSRKIVSKVLRWLIRVFFSIPFTDTQCGLKGFRKGVKSIFLETTIDRYLFDLEFIRNGYKKGFKIQAVPIKLNPGIEFRKVNYRILIPEVFNLVKLIFR